MINEKKHTGRSRPVIVERRRKRVLVTRQAAHQNPEPALAEKCDDMQKTPSRTETLHLRPQDSPPTYHHKPFTSAPETTPTPANPCLR